MFQLVNTNEITFSPVFIINKLKKLILVLLIILFLAPIFNILVEGAEAIPPTVATAATASAAKSVSTTVVGSCEDPIGWIENKANRTANSNSYFAPIRRDIPATATPTKNPDLYLIKSCLSTVKVNYVDKKGVYQKVDNTLVSLDKDDNTKPNELPSADQKKYQYTNKGNDFSVYLPKNASDGFAYVSKDLTFRVTKITFGSSVLKNNTPKIEGNKITYNEILPGVDLQYVVDNATFSKYFYLKDEKALDNDLSKIEMELDTNSKTISKQKKDNSKADSIVNPEDRIIVDNQVKTELLPPVTYLNINSQVPEQAINSASSSSYSVSLSSDKISSPNASNSPTSNKSSSTSAKTSSAASTASSPKINTKTAKADNQAFNLSTKTAKDPNQILTIYPDVQNWKNLNKNGDLTFPIVIDPQFRDVGSFAGDTFASNQKTTGGTYANRDGSYKNWLAISNNASFNGGQLGQAYYGYSETYLQFDMPAEIGADTSVIDARLRLQQYASYNQNYPSDVVANIIQMDNSFSENDVNFNNKPNLDVNKQVGKITFPNYNLNGSGNTARTESWRSDNISQIVRNNINTRKVAMGLYISNPGQGVVVCSKDASLSWHPCSDSSKAPKLEISFNRRPSAPIVNTPDSGDYLGNCDFSLNGNTDQKGYSSGSCDLTQNINFNIANINDGDGGVDDEARVRVTAQDLMNQRDDWRNISDFVGPYVGTVNLGLNTKNGVYNYNAHNKDKYGLESPDSNTRGFYVDTAAPTRISSNQLPTFTGRDALNPTNTTPQLTTKLPAYTDNLSSKFVIRLVSDLNKVIEIPGGNHGTGIAATVNSANYNSQSQLWNFDNSNLKISNDSCLDDNNGISVLSQSCSKIATQRWYYDDVTQSIRNYNGLCLTTTPALAVVTRACENTTSNPNQNPLQKLTIEKVDFVRIKHTNSGKSLDAASNCNNCNTQTLSSNAENAQAFIYIPSTKEFRNYKNNNLCLDARYNVNADYVTLNNCYGGINQKWVTDTTTGSTRIKSLGGIDLPNNKSKCIDTGGGANEGQAMRINDCHTVNSNQDFATETFFKAFLPNLDLSYNNQLTDGNGNSRILGWQASNTLQFPNNLQDRVTIRLRDYNNKSLDAGAYKSGEYLRINDSHGGENQQFVYTKDNEIRTLNGMCLDSASGASNGSTLYFNATCHGGSNQKFEFENGNRNGGNIKLKGTNYCLNLWGANTANQTAIKIYDCSTNGWNIKFTTTSLDTLNSLVDGQKYCLKNKAKDRTLSNPGNISEWYDMGCTTIDMGLPEIKDVTVSNNRISKNASSSINFKLKEKNIKSVSLGLFQTTKDASGASLRTKVKDFSNVAIPGINGVSGNYNQNDFNNLSINWNGTDDQGNSLADGIYEIQIIATDLAGNKNIEQSGSLNYATVDNTPANIGITFPVNNWWTNKDNVTVTGGLATFNNANNQDKDSSKLEITKDGVTNSVNIDKNNNFSYPLNLGYGVNTFTLKSTDLSNNVTTLIGDPTKQLADKWVINREDVAPTINNIKVNNQALVNDQYLVNGVQNLTFGLVDPVTNSQTAASGFDLDGTNLKNLNLSLIKNTDNNQTTEIPLVKNGVKLADNSFLVGYTCSVINPNDNTNISCVINFNNLNTDGIYKLNISATDKAGNNVSAQSNSFAIKNSVYQKINNPSSFSYNSSSAIINGESEENATISITNTTSNQNNTFKASDNGSNVLCGKIVNQKRVCTWTSSVNLAPNSNAATPLMNNLSVESSFGNILNNQYQKAVISTQALAINVNLYNLSLNSTADKNIFNPQGSNLDFQKISFNNSAKDANGIEINNLATATIKIQNSFKTQTVLTKNLTIANGFLSSTFAFDGKDASGLVLPNGDYIYSLSVTNTSGISTATADQKITVFAPSATDNRTVLMSPKSDLITTKGVVNTAGYTLKNAKVTVCLVLDGSSKCLNSYSTTSDNTGYFSTLLTLPYSPAKYAVTASSIDMASNQTPVSSPVSINITNDGSIRGVDLVSSLDGLNTDSQLSCLNGTSFNNATCSVADANFNINSAKTLKITTKVAKFTEALQLDFSDASNVNGNTASKTIALINNSTETKTRLNPTNDSRVKGNLLGQNFSINGASKTISDIASLRESGNALSGVCLQEECEWTFNYPYPANLSGGTYEIRIRSYKGDSINEVTKGFSINGQLKTNPAVLRAEKKQLTNKCSFVNGNTDVSNNSNTCKDTENAIAKENLLTPASSNLPITAYYSNNNYFKLYTGSDPLSKIAYTITKPTNQSSVQASLDSTAATSIVPLTTINVNNGGIATLETAIASSNLSSGGEGNFIVTFGLLNSNNDGLVSTSTTSYLLVIDRTIPNLLSVTTTNLSNSRATNSWLHSGDNIGFSYNVSEPVLSSSVISEAGFRSVGLKGNTLPKSLNVNASNVDCTTFTELDYITNSSRIPNGCKSAFINTTNNLNTNLTILRDSLEGVYYSSIILTDLAGNSSVFGNDTSTNSGVATLKQSVKANLKSNSNGSDNYDFDPLAYSNVNILTPISNTNIYSPTNRAASLDFRLFIDNTSPVISDFDITNFNTEDGIRADGLTPEIDRLPVSGIRYITKGKNISLKAQVEKNMRAVLFVKRGDTRLNPSLVSDTSTILNSSDIQGNGNTSSAPTCSQSAAPSKVNMTGDKLGLGQVLVSSRDDCNTTFSYTFNDDGLTSSSSEPFNYYDFSFYPIDLAGNAPLSELDQVKQDAISGINRNTRDTCPNSVVRDTASNRSCSVLVYHDTVAVGASGTVGTNINSIKSGSYGNTTDSNSPSIPDFYNTSILPITKDTNIAINTSTEQKTDIEYKLKDKNNNFVAVSNNNVTIKTDATNNLNQTLNSTTTNQSIVVRNGDVTNPSNTTNLKLGSVSDSNSDKRDDDGSKGACTQTNNNAISSNLGTIPATTNRNIGTCSDGLYQVNVRAIDTAGNRLLDVAGNPIYTTKIIERDTVSPSSATQSLTKTGDILREGASFNLTGESNTTASIKITAKNENGSPASINIGGQTSNDSNGITKSITIPDSGTYSDEDLLGKLSCGKITYTVTTKLSDRAGNISGETSSSVTSDLCPSCGGNTIISPLHDPKFYITEPFGISAGYSEGKQFHYGVDFAYNNSSTNIYPAFNGTIKRIISNVTVQRTYSGNYNDIINYGNMIDIDNGNGMLTRYTHIAYGSIPANLKVGDSVTTDTQIGVTGQTGNAYGIHLHFEIRINRVAQDPVSYLNNKASSQYNAGNLTSSQRIAFSCDEIRGGGNGDPDSEGQDLSSLSPELRALAEKYRKTGIQEPFKVTNNNSAWNTADDDIHIGVYTNERNINFKMITRNANDIDNIGYYDGTSNVWIIIHGWYKDVNSASYDSNYMDCNKFQPNDTSCSSSVSQTLKQAKPNDIILDLDWREAAASSKFDSSIVSSGFVDRAAKWITPVAKEAANKLKGWGLKDGSKLNFVGHSLGTLMSTEIARQYGGANSAVLLDPPSQFNICKFMYMPIDICWGYDIDGNTSGDQVPGVNIDPNSYYRKQFNFSRSLSGTRSIAGNKYLAPTTNESVKVNFDGTNCNNLGLQCSIEEHFSVIDVFNRLNSNTPLYNDYLSYKNMYKNSNFSNNAVGDNYNIEIYADKQDHAGRDYIEYAWSYDSNSNTRNIYGTSRNNYITTTQPAFYNYKTNIYGGGGDDTFDISTNNNTIIDFSDSGDNIKLSNRGVYIKSDSRTINYAEYTKCNFYLTPSYFCLIPDSSYYFRVYGSKYLYTNQYLSNYNKLI